MHKGAQTRPVGLPSWPVVSWTRINGHLKNHGIYYGWLCSKNDWYNLCHYLKLSYMYAHFYIVSPPLKYKFLEGRGVCFSLHCSGYSYSMGQNDNMTIWYFEKDQNVGISLKKVRCGHQNLLCFIQSSSWRKARVGPRQFCSSRRMMVKVKYPGEEELGTSRGSSPFLGGEQSKFSPGERKLGGSEDLILHLSLPYPPILLPYPPFVWLNGFPHLLF